MTLHALFTQCLNRLSALSRSDEERDEAGSQTQMSQSPFGSVPVGPEELLPEARRILVSIAFRLCPGRTLGALAMMGGGVVSQSPFGSVPVGLQLCVGLTRTGLSQSPFGSVPVGRDRQFLRGRAQVSQSPFGSVPVGQTQIISKLVDEVSQSPFGSVPVGHYADAGGNVPGCVSIAFRLCPGRTSRDRWLPSRASCLNRLSALSRSDICDTRNYCLVECLNRLSALSRSDPTQFSQESIATCLNRLSALSRSDTRTSAFFTWYKCLNRLSALSRSDRSSGVL